MKMEECGPFDEIFTHIPDDGSPAIHVNASAMFRAAPQALKDGVAEHISTFIEPEFVNFIVEKRGVEKWKLDRLIEPFLSLPLIGVWTPDGSCLTVDGHHRIVRLAAEGRLIYHIIIFQNSELAQYCIEDFPDDFAKHLEEVTKNQDPGGSCIILP